MSKNIIACVGRMHSGKDVFCEMIQELVAPESVEMIRFSDPLGNCLKRMKQQMPGCAGMPLDRTHYQEFSTIIRQEIHPDLLAQWVKQKALESEAQWVLIMGMRKLQDLPAMRELPKCTVVSVFAYQGLRWRWTKRSAEKKGHEVPTIEAFKKQDGQECEVDIDLLERRADWQIVNDVDDPELTHIRAQTVDFLASLSL